MLDLGNRIKVSALHYDGVCYRWWYATVEEIIEDCIVTISPMGETIHEPNGPWVSRVHCRTYYWKDRWFSLSELYGSNGEPLELYLHIASPPFVGSGDLQYHDYELDVVKSFGVPPRVVDEEEFQQAILRYGYSPAFQARCRSAVAQAVELVDAWVWKGLQTTKP